MATYAARDGNFIGSFTEGLLLANILVKEAIAVCCSCTEYRQLLFWLNMRAGQTEVSLQASNKQGCSWANMWTFSLVPVEHSLFYSRSHFTDIVLLLAESRGHDCFAE